jgi:adenylyltransferase/sulfurtransferase
MDSIDTRCASLRAQIVATETQLANLKSQLVDAEKAAATVAAANISQVPDNRTETKGDGVKTSKWPLLAEEYKRYGRQMIVPEIGIHGTPLLHIYIYT